MTNCFNTPHTLTLNNTHHTQEQLNNVINCQRTEQLDKLIKIVTNHPMFSLSD